MHFFRCFLLLSLFFTGCKKDNETQLNYNTVESGSGYDLRCIYMHNINELFVGGGDDTHGILLLSTDQGASFNNFNQPFTSRINNIVFSHPSKVFVTGNNFLLMRSDDRGVTWNKIENTTPVPYQYQTNLYDIKFINDTIGFFCGGEEFNHGVIGKTTDGGSTWKYTFLDHEMRTIDFKDSQHGYCGGYGAMLYTNDGGEHWQITESNNEFITALHLTSSNGIASGYNGGILRNQNSFDWMNCLRSNSVFNHRSHFNSVCTIDGTNYFVFGNDGKSAISNDAGANWKQTTAFDKTTIFDAITLSTNTGIAVGANGKIFNFSK